ncbi:Fc.00g012300.m01.CDS01 [Cosmosporella sp. VM-42]
MALRSPRLMAAILCAAASHRLSVGLEHLDDVIRLRAVAIQRLNLGLASSDPHDSMTALGTSLVLCMSEIVSPEATGGDWRVHLSGASALLRRLDGHPEIVESSMKFMKRFYASLEVISAGCGISDGKELFGDESMKSSDYIDDLAGFSTALVPIFESISDMDRTSNLQSLLCHEDTITVPANPLPQALRLIERVRTMLVLRSIKLRPEISSLPTTAKTDFELLDEAYHHMALLQLYERVDEANRQFLGAIQESVERIISCIGAMDIAARPCSGVATLPH